jgi:putative intracellular protease/amidase
MRRTSRTRLVRGLSYALAMVLTPLLAGIAGLVLNAASDVRSGTNPPPFTGALPAPPPHDTAKRTAVVIAANSATEGTDFLAPFAVLANSGAFNLYAVAPERRITHLFSGSALVRGVDFVPHYGFAEYDVAIGDNPDLIVIPFLPIKQAPEYQQILGWVRAHAGPNTIVLSICAGAKNLAETGLLDGRSATTHHYTFPEIAQEHPSVKLVRGVRYIEDSNLITSAGVTAGVDATLYVLKRLLGRGAALDVAQQIGYPYARFLDEPAYDLPVPALGNLGATAPPLASLFLAGLRGDSQLGVALYEGMDELALASVVDTYPHDGTQTVNTVAPERSVVISRHGLALVPRWSFADAPRLHRLVLPGRDADAEIIATFERWAQGRFGLAVDRVHQADGYVYDVTFNDMATRSGSVAANLAIYLLEYPLGRATVTAPLFPLMLAIRIIALALVGLGLAALLDRRLTRRRERRRARALRPAAS